MLDIHIYLPKKSVHWKKKNIQYTQSCEKAVDTYVKKTEISSEFLRLVLFPTEPEAETDPRSQADIHHGSVGFGGICMNFICMAVFNFCTSVSFKS